MFASFLRKCDLLGQDNPSLSPQLDTSFSTGEIAIRVLKKFWGQKWSCQFNQLSQALEKIRNIFSLTGCETFQRGFLLANGSFHGFSNFL